MFVNMLHNRLTAAIRVMFMSRVYSSDWKNELGLAENRKVTIERTITKEDVDLFSKITGDFNVVHSSSKERRGIVHGALLNGIVSGVIGTQLPGNGTIVLSQTLNFPNPCFVGETVIVTVEVENVRKILTCKYEVINKLNQSIVMNGSAKLLFKASNGLK